MSESVDQLVHRSKVAQEIAETYDQGTVNHLSKVIAWAGVKRENADKLARLAVEETAMGDYEGKLGKLQFKLRGALRDMLEMRTVGVCGEDKAKGLTMIAKPVGTIGALVPCTNPSSTAFLMAMWAVKGRNSVIVGPHPRSKRTSSEAVAIIRAALAANGAPRDLVIGIENPTKTINQELMRKVDLVVATGGAQMVRSAYSSGKPAYGVGTGNAVMVVDDDADLGMAARSTRLSQVNDLATGCSSENSLVIHRAVYAQMLAKLAENRGFLLDVQQKQALRRKMWPDGELSRDVIGKSARDIAAMAEIHVPPETDFLLVNETGIGPQSPFSGEKLCPVLAVYEATDMEEALATVNHLHSYAGSGHSCGIYSNNEAHIRKFCTETKTSRVMVNQSTGLRNAGGWDSGMPVTASLGCGTWGGNITTENISMKHFLNITYVSRPVAELIPNDQELFGDALK